MSKEERITAWTEADELNFIDHLAGSDLRSAAVGQTKKRMLTKSEKVLRVEHYICSIKRRSWPEHINPSRMENHALRVLQTVL